MPFYVPFRSISVVNLLSPRKSRYVSILPCPVDWFYYHVLILPATNSVLESKNVVSQRMRKHFALSLPISLTVAVEATMVRVVPRGISRLFPWRHVLLHFIQYGGKSDRISVEFPDGGQNVELFFCLYDQHWDNPPMCNSSHSRLLGFFTALPGIWRALQCIRRYVDTKNVFPHLVNCGKYTCTILFYVSLSLYRISKTNELWALFIVFGSLNSIYCSAYKLCL